MNIICIYGSPRKDGNSDTLLNKVIEGIESVRSKDTIIKKVYVRDLNISNCQECRKCDKTGMCIIKDDMQKVYKDMETTDYSVVSSPIFFYGLPGKLKTLIDRTQCYWAGKYLLSKERREKKEESRKHGIFLSVGATKGEKLFEGAKLTIKYFFDVFDIKYSEDLLVRAIDKKGEILNKPDELTKAFELGKKL